MDETVFPKHAGGFELHKDPHKREYKPLAVWLEHNEPPADDWFSWVSAEQRSLAIEKDTIWILQWWPDTPVGDYCVAAASLDELLHYACTMDVGHG